MVSTRKGSVKTSKGKIPVLKSALWPLVAEQIRTQLQLLGVIVIEAVFEREQVGLHHQAVDCSSAGEGGGVTYSGLT